MNLDTATEQTEIQGKDTGNTNQGKVLVVDDQTKNLELIGGILKKEGYRVALADSGRAALEVLKSDRFDLVLLDIMMPEMDGYELCALIREKEMLKELPVIFLTARGDKKDIVRGFREGGQDYVTKPFNRPELLERVRTQVELKRSRESLRTMNEKLEERVRERTRLLEETVKELKQANERLIRLDEAKKGFLQIISHELRTPLNGIRGFSEILRKNNPDDRFSLYYDMIDTSITRLEEFTFLALDITALYLGKRTLNMRQFDLAGVVTGELEKLAGRVAKKKIKVNWKPPRKGVRFNGDPKLLGTLFSVLLGNAIKHGPEEGYVSVTLDTTEQYHLVRVSDQGRGFPNSIMKGDFELFDSEHHVNLNMGLHLPYAQLIARAHRGKLELRNNPTKGATVDCYLPR